MAMIGTSRCGESHSAPAIMHRLRITGVTAGKANLLKLLRIPPDKAVSETNSRNGKVSRSKSVVRANFSGSSMEPGANPRVTQPAPIMPRAVTISRIKPSVPAVRDTSSFNSACGRVSLTSVSTGTKATENEPSANRRRMKLGMRKATQKASVAAEAPNAQAIAISRNRPRMRDTRVPPLNVSSERSMLGAFIDRTV